MARCRSFQPRLKGDSSGPTPCAPPSVRPANPGGDAPGMLGWLPSAPRLGALGSPGSAPPLLVAGLSSSVGGGRGSATALLAASGSASSVTRVQHRLRACRGTVVRLTHADARLSQAVGVLPQHLRRLGSRRVRHARPAGWLRWKREPLGSSWSCRNTVDGHCAPPLLPGAASCAPLTDIPPGRTRRTPWCLAGPRAARPGRQLRGTHPTSPHGSCLPLVVPAKDTVDTSTCSLPKCRGTEQTSWSLAGAHRLGLLGSLRPLPPGFSTCTLLVVLPSDRDPIRVDILAADLVVRHGAPPIDTVIPPPGASGVWRRQPLPHSPRRVHKASLHALDERPRALLAHVAVDPEALLESQAVVSGGGFRETSVASPSGNNVLKLPASRQGS